MTDSSRIAPRIAVVQLRTPDDQAEAWTHAKPLLQQAVEGGARLILTPEASNILQRDRSRLLPSLASLDDDIFVLEAREFARRHEVAMLIGSALVRREDGQAANRSVLIDSFGAIGATYDKIHMFDVDLPARDGRPAERHRESAVYKPGVQAVIASTPVGLLGLSVCYDLRFASLYRQLAQAGAIAIAIPAAFTQPTGEAHWEVLLRARAIETGAYVLAPAQGGVHADGRATWGRSMVVAPWGEVVARLDHDEPAVLFAELDPGEVHQARIAVPALANDRSFSPPALGSPVLV